MTITIIQAIGLTGLGLCLLLILYVLTARSLDLQSWPALLFFGWLGVGFGLLVAGGDDPDPGIIIAAALVQAVGPALGGLIVMQAEDGRKTPGWRDGVIFAPLPVAFLPAATLPLEFVNLFQVAAVVAGCASLLVLAVTRGSIASMGADTRRREFYWLGLSILLVFLLQMAVDLNQLSGLVDPSAGRLVRGILGLSLAYLAGTLLFRLAPAGDDAPDATTPADKLVPFQGPAAEPPPPLDQTEAALAREIERLLSEEKLFLEPEFSRADLADRLGVTENTVSRVINAAFGRGFRQLINQRRVEEAIRLLTTTDDPVIAIAGNSGFNSLPSFNRCFKSITGSSPSHFRSGRGTGEN